MRAATSRSTRWTRRRAIAEQPDARLAGHQVGLDHASARRAAAATTFPRTSSASSKYEFIDWRERKSAHEILDELRVAMAGIPGVDVEVRVPDAGPPTGKAIQVQLSAVDPTGLNDKAAAGRGAPSPRCPASSTSPTACRRPASTGRLRSTAPRPRSTASARCRSARSSSSSPPASSSPTTGRPAPTMPSTSGCACRRTAARSSTLDQLRVETAQGSVPISNFVSRASRSRPSASSTASTASAPSPSRPTWRRGFQVAAVQAAGQPGRRRHGQARRRLEAGRLERGQRGGRRLPEQRLRRGDLPDLHRAAGAVQQVHQRCAGAVPAWSWRRSARCSACC